LKGRWTASVAVSDVVITKPEITKKTQTPTQPNDATPV
jgi:hypothetical protein